MSDKSSIECTTPTISTREAFDDLMGTVCKGCGQPKTPSFSHCRPCYFSLSKVMQKRLHNPIGKGYETAYTQSLAMLKDE